MEPWEASKDAHTSGPSAVSRARLITAAVVAGLAAIVLIPGLIDPVEGSLPVILGGLLLLASWLIGRVTMPRLAWISWIVTFLSGASTLIIVISWRDLTEGSAGEGIGALHPAVLIPLIVYEVGVLTTIAGAVWNATRITARARRHHPQLVSD
jgi:hypothetical protein